MFEVLIADWSLVVLITEKKTSQEWS